MSKVPQPLITYCTNIHPGETWEETFAALRAHVPAVKAAVSPAAPFPLGLRLSDRASRELTGAEAGRFACWLADEDLFVPTINGFPFGAFHGTRIKEQAYLPDWRCSERVAYTKRLADLLGSWLPTGATGSISTVPVGFTGCVGREDDRTVRDNLLAVLTHLERIRQGRGPEIVLALEPEPGCLLETAADACRFIADMAFPAALADLIGVCYDCCHQAVAFEDPAASIAGLAAAGIRLGKVQVSSALRFFDADRETLGRFDEPWYLHQVVVRGQDGALARYPDVPDALDRHVRCPGDEWRCHFHIPIFQQDGPAFATTRFFIEEVIPHLPSRALLEVETYSWAALPPELRSEGITASIVREIQWLETQFHAAHRRS